MIQVSLLTAILSAMMRNGVRMPTHGTLKKPKTSTHPMITASDDEIRTWNSRVKTRQVLRRRARPWKHDVFQKMTKMVKAGHS